MRKYLFAAGLLAVCFASCTKQEVIVNGPKDKPLFRVLGLSDIKMERNPFTYPKTNPGFMYLDVLYESGNDKFIRFSIEGLPAGLKDSFSMRSGYSDFSTSVIIYDQGVPEDNYKVQLVAKVAGDSVSKRYSFTIAVVGDTSCGKYFAGKSFSAINSCATNAPDPPVPYNSGSFQLNGTDTLVISNFKNDGTNLKILINCLESKVAVPTQIINGKSFRGYGQLTAYAVSFPNIIILDLTEVDAQGNVALCNYSFEIK